MTAQLDWEPGEGFTLTFTLVFNRDPEVRRDLAPAIRRLVEAAPELAHWKVVAFAEPVSWKDAYLPQLDIPNKTLRLDGLKHVVVSREPLRLRVFVDGYDERKDGHFRIAVERLLEAGMGEAWVLEIDELELSPLDEAPSDAHPMPNLEDAIDS